MSTLAFIDRKLELNDEAIYYYVKAAVNDIRSATKESVSMRGLATMLYYHKNDVNRASEYINEAFEDATFMEPVTGLMSSELYYLYLSGRNSI